MHGDVAFLKTVAPGPVARGDNGFQRAVGPAPALEQRVQHELRADGAGLKLAYDAVDEERHVIVEDLDDRRRPARAALSEHGLADACLVPAFWLLTDEIGRGLGMGGQAFGGEFRKIRPVGGCKQELGEQRLFAHIGLRPPLQVMRHASASMASDCEPAAGPLGLPPRSHEYTCWMRLS